MSKQREIQKSKSAYIEYLNEVNDHDTVMLLTEHLWAGNDKSERQKQEAWSLCRRGQYGECIQKFDPIAFNVGFNDWER